MGKRIVALFSTLIFLFSAMIWRLSWISRKEDFAQAANQQSTYTLEVWRLYCLLTKALLL